MTFLALVISILSGALCAALVCKRIKLELWSDVLVGFGSVACMWLSTYLAGSSEWPFFGFFAGFAAIVIYIRLHGASA